MRVEDERVNLFPDEGMHTYFVRVPLVIYPYAHTHMHMMHICICTHTHTGDSDEPLYNTDDTDLDVPPLDLSKPI